ncbi:MAG: NAD(P)-binding oxidoreductase [Myxococcota bacterium]
MRLIIFGANGGLGQWVWKAAVSAGHEVVAYVRTPSKLDRADARFETLQVVAGDVMDAEAVRSASTGCQIAINCTSPAGGNGTVEMVQSIVPNAAAGGVQTFYLVGGIGALWVPGTNRSVLLQDWDDPDAMKRYGLPPGMPRDVIQRMTRGHLASMAYLESTGLPHCYLCPGAMVDGPATESRVVTLDELGGQSAMRVRFGNIAQVIVDDLDHGKLIGHRVCVADA